MKKIYLLVFFCTNHFFGQYTLIPDPVFEQNLINQQIDSNSIIDGKVLTSAISSITQILLTSLNGGFEKITNLDGIQGFIALEKLTLFANDDGMTSINITNNMNLKELFFYGNYLNNLLVSAPILEKLVIENPAPFLQTLNVINCPKLNYLWCPNNSLNTLDVSNNPELEKLLVHNNNLTQLIFGNNLKLKILYNYNNNLSSLDLTSCPFLQTVYCWNNVLTSIDLTNCSELINLGIYNNNLTNLDVTQNILLQSLYCGVNNLVSLDLLSNSILKKLGCSINMIMTLNLQYNSQLEQFDCYDNNLTTLNIQNGNNNLLNGNFTIGQNSYPRFNATNNPNLKCILVNDVANCQTNWLNIDPASHFVDSQAACNNLLDNQFFSANEFNISPNPTNGTINIDFGQIQSLLEIKLSNVLGQLISSKTVSNLDKTTLEINESSGVYFLEIFNDKHEKQVFKVIKE